MHIFVCFNFCLILLFVAKITSMKDPYFAIKGIEWWQKEMADKTGYEKKSVMRAQSDPSSCTLSAKHMSEIESYRTTVQKIIETSTTGKFKGTTMQELAMFVDTFGSRISGSDSLENALTSLRETLFAEGLKNVHEEQVTIPKWIRGDEQAKLMEPREKKLSIKGLGFSVPTPDGGIIAEGLVISSFKQLVQKQEQVKGKIVIFNSETEGPLHCIFGAAAGAKYGAVAVLARSSATFSLYSPHTGIQFYDENIRKIPIAALTLEDADMLSRYAERGEKIKLHISMTNIENTKRLSRNIIGDFVGKEKPDEMVMLAGHVDSWDVGDGAIDDGVGPILAIQVIRMLKYLNLQPKRTIRNAFFTAEEAGLVGAFQWVKDNANELDKYSAAIEVQPAYFSKVHLTEAACIMEHVLSLMKETNATSFQHVRGTPTDIYALGKHDVPNIVLNGDDGRYFWYHHTEADTIHALDSNTVDKCLAVWASTAYIIADLNENLPR